MIDYEWFCGKCCCRMAYTALTLYFFLCFVFFSLSVNRVKLLGESVLHETHNGRAHHKEVCALNMSHKSPNLINSCQ